MANFRRTEEKYLFNFPYIFQRNTRGPLDNTSVFSSLYDAEVYAKNSPLAYFGQVISVASEEKTNVYVINQESKLLELAVFTEAPSYDEYFETIISRIEDLESQNKLDTEIFNEYKSSIDEKIQKLSNSHTGFDNRIKSLETVSVTESTFTEKTAEIETSITELETSLRNSIKAKISKEKEDREASDTKINEEIENLKLDKVGNSAFNTQIESFNKVIKENAEKHDSDIKNINDEISNINLNKASAELVANNQNFLIKEINRLEALIEENTSTGGEATESLKEYLENKLADLKKEINKLIDAESQTRATEIGRIDTEVSTLNTNLSDEVSARTTADNEINTRIDDFQAEMAKELKELEEAILDLVNPDAPTNDSVTEIIDKKIDELEKRVASEISEVRDIANNAVINVSNIQTSLNAALANEKSLREKADREIDARIDTEILTEISNTNDRIQSVSDEIKTVKTNIEGLIETETSERETSDNAIREELSKNINDNKNVLENSISETLKISKEYTEEKINAEKLSREQSIQTVSSRVSSNKTAIDDEIENRALEDIRITNELKELINTTDSQQKASLEKEINDVETQISNISKSLNEKIESEGKTREGVDNAILKRISNVEANILTETNTRESEDSSIRESISSLESTINKKIEDGDKELEETLSDHIGRYNSKVLSLEQSIQSSESRAKAYSDKKLKEEKDTRESEDLKLLEQINKVNNEKLNTVTFVDYRSTMSGEINALKKEDQRLEDLIQLLGNTTDIMNWRGTYKSLEEITDPKDGDVCIVDNIIYLYKTDKDSSQWATFSDPTIKSYIADEIAKVEQKITDLEVTFDGDLDEIKETVKTEIQGELTTIKSNIDRLAVNKLDKSLYEKHLDDFNSLSNDFDELKDNIIDESELLNFERQINQKLNNTDKKISSLEALHGKIDNKLLTVSQEAQTIIDSVLEAMFEKDNHGNIILRGGNINDY